MVKHQHRVVNLLQFEAFSSSAHLIVWAIRAHIYLHTSVCKPHEWQLAVRAFAIDIPEAVLTPAIVSKI